MQPYQKASEEIIRQQSEPSRLVKTAAKTALGLAGGGVAVRRIAPFLSQYIPEDIFVKGLSKIDPRLGKFIRSAMEQGHSVDDVKNFMGEKVQESEPLKTDKNVVEQYSPELHQFLSEHIQKGRSPLEAAGMATLDQTGRKSFKRIIDKITKDHKSPWSAIVESVYGSNLTPKQQAVKKYNQHKKGVLEQETDRFNQAYGPQQQSTPTAEQQFQATLQKVLQRLGG